MVGGGAAGVEGGGAEGVEGGGGEVVLADGGEVGAGAAGVAPGDGDVDIAAELLFITTVYFSLNSRENIAVVFVVLEIRIVKNEESLVLVLV